MHQSNVVHSIRISMLLYANSAFAYAPAIRLIGRHTACFKKMFTYLLYALNIIPNIRIL